MEVDAFERVYEAFGDFHAFFAPAFGRKQWREHSGHYLQALLVQSQERRNAENLAEMVPVSARALQRFLTEARWDDDAVIARLQEYLGPRLEHPLAVWVFDGSDFPKQGVKSVGVTRQYCGALEMLRQARARGCLSAGWAAGDDAFGMSPGFRDGLTAEGMQYVLDVPPDTPVWPLEPTWSRPAYEFVNKSLNSRVREVK